LAGQKDWWSGRLIATPPVGCRVGLTGVGDRAVDVELARSLSNVDEGAGSAEGTKSSFADVDLGNLDKGIVIDAYTGAAEGTKSSSCDGGCNLSNGTVINDGSGTAEGTQPLFSDGSSQKLRTRELSDRMHERHSYESGICLAVQEGANILCQDNECRQSDGCALIGLGSIQMAYQNLDDSWQFLVVEQ